jgi:hypothetical protein
MNDETKVAASFESLVWDTLSRIEVSDHIDHLPKTKKRPAVAYLPWHKAWMLTKRKFPASTYSHRADITHSDGSVEVEVDVVIANTHGGDTFFTNARLAVMDQWFNAIPNPDARSVNDARQRCLVKALAFAGLGLNLWADGSVIPVGKLSDPISPKQFDELNTLITETETDISKFLEWCEVESLDQLPFERFGSAYNLLRAKKLRVEAAKEAGK